MSLLTPFDPNNFEVKYEVNIQELNNEQLIEFLQGQKVASSVLAAIREAEYSGLDIVDPCVTFLEDAFQDDLIQQHNIKPLDLRSLEKVRSKFVPEPLPLPKKAAVPAKNCLLLRELIGSVISEHQKNVLLSYLSCMSDFWQLTEHSVSAMKIPHDSTRDLIALKKSLEEEGWSGIRPVPDEVAMILLGDGANTAKKKQAVSQWCDVSVAQELLFIQPKTDRTAGLLCRFLHPLVLEAGSYSFDGLADTMEIMSFFINSRFSCKNFMMLLANLAWLSKNRARYGQESMYDALVRVAQSASCADGVYAVSIAISNVCLEPKNRARLVCPEIICLLSDLAKQISPIATTQHFYLDSSKFFSAALFNMSLDDDKVWMMRTPDMLSACEIVKKHLVDQTGKSWLDTALNRINR